MKPLVCIVPSALTIGLDILTVRDYVKVLKKNKGYIDGDQRQLVIFGEK